MVDTILIVDSDLNIHEHIGSILRELAYQVCCVFSAKEALNCIEKNEVNLVLMDLSLPDMGGFHLLNLIHLMRDTPIIILSAADDENNRIRAFEEGADDFVAKPLFSLRELVMRIQAVLRRGRPRKISLSRIKIDIINKRVWRDSQEITLTAQRFRFLVALALYPNHIRTRDELINEICHEDDNYNYRLLYTIAYALRRLIEPDPAHPQFIHSVHGVGYYLKDIGSR
jgi:two-component system, OmpR family, response regulator RegX3